MVDYFEHQPLADARNQIRLIQVQHCDESEPSPLLQLSIKSINREDVHKHYRALSYRWGDVYPLHSIQINNKIFEVQQNLFDFLKHVSQKQTEDPTDWNGWWWVDALCIQQKDEDREKASQIEGMRQTYADALQTIVWLGPGNMESTRGMESLERVLRSHDSNTSDAALKEVQDLVSTDPCMIAAVDKVFGNAYWMRVWILQELAVSNADGRERSLQDRVHIVLGDFTTTWDRFLGISHSLGHTRLPLENQNDRSRYQKNLARLWKLNLLIKPYEGAAGDSLGYLLRLAKDAESSKPQDYIYALLGLTNNHCRGEIRPSYNMSGCVVICQAIRWMAVESLGSPSARFSVRWTEDCRTLAENAQHNAFDDSPHMKMERERCLGLSHELGCSENTCSRQHCDALEVCRKIAESLYWGWTVFTYLEEPATTGPLRSAASGLVVSF